MYTPHLTTSHLPASGLVALVLALPGELPCCPADLISLAGGRD